MDSCVRSRLRRTVFGTGVHHGSRSSSSKLSVSNSMGVPFSVVVFSCAASPVRSRRNRLPMAGMEASSTGTIARPSATPELNRTYSHGEAGARSSSGFGSGHAIPRSCVDSVRRWPLRGSKASTREIVPLARRRLCATSRTSPCGPTTARIK